MSPKAFISFSLVTIVIVIAASFSIVSRYGDSGSTRSTERLFPGFSEKVNEVAEVAYRDRELTLTLKRDGDTWTIAERSDYVADSDIVRNLLVGLAEMRRGEPKTKLKDRYHRLAVSDISVETSQSKLLTLKDGSGDVIAELIVGKETEDVAGGVSIGRYVRMPGEERAWLAEGRLTVPDSVKLWVKPEFVHVDPKRIVSATVRQPDGEVMNISRIDPNGSKFRIDGLAESAKVKYPNDVDNIADALDRLELDDVRKAGAIEFPADKIVKTEYRTIDGLIVNAESFEDDKSKFWARYSARVADGLGDDVAAKAKAEAAKINATVGPWVYQIPAFKYRYMTRRTGDVLENEGGS